MMNWLQVKGCPANAALAALHFAASCKALMARLAELTNVSCKDSGANRPFRGPHASHQSKLIIVDLGQ